MLQPSNHVLFIMNLSEEQKAIVGFLNDSGMSTLSPIIKFSGAAKKDIEILMETDFVLKEGHIYTLSQKGINWAKQNFQ